MLTVPNWLPAHQFSYDPALVSPNQLTDLREKLARFTVGVPLISIVVPAYNEEANLLNTLSSLASQQLAYPTELIVVNNNSSDRTQQLLDQCGVRSITERQPGVAHARQAGLTIARGKYIASADADCLYPPNWVSAITEPLQQASVACTYGLYSFLPGPQAPRLVLAAYEQMSHTLNFMRSFNKPYLNVYGFNFAFRREDALALGGFALDSGWVGSIDELVANNDAPPVSQRAEDGWMALSLMEAGNGSIHRVSKPGAHVWTSARRLMAHGSLMSAFTDRVKRTVGLKG